MICPENIHYMVIGDPIAHSRSPGMQNAAFAACGLGRPYCGCRVTPAELPEFIRFARERLRGVNLTVPHKQAVIPLIDDVDPHALAAGSVNTLVIDHGRICGFSTDGVGFERAVAASLGIAIAGKRFLLCGSGGAACAIGAHLALNHAAAVHLVNRTAAHAEALGTMLRKAAPALEITIHAPDDTHAFTELLHNCDLLIQATSLGVRPGDPAPFDLALLAPGVPGAVFDAIYCDTPLLRRCRELGIAAADGREMLIQQGAASFELWTGMSAPVEAMRRGFMEKHHDLV